MYIEPKHLQGVKRFDRNHFRPVANSTDARKRSRLPKSSDRAIRLP